MVDPTLTLVAMYRNTSEGGIFILVTIMVIDIHKTS